MVAKLALAALLMLALGGGLYLWLGRGSAAPPPPSPPPFVDLEAGYLERAVAATDGEQALAILREGLEKLPHSSRLARSYLERALVEEPPPDILQIYIEERMATAEQFLTDKEYEGAYEVLEWVLFVDPGHEKAQEISDSIESRRQRQRRERRARPAAAAPSPPPVVAVPPPTALPPPPPPPGELHIDFSTIIAEGKIRVEVGGQTLLDRAFDFPNRRTFRRKYLGEVRGFEEERMIESGEVNVQVSVEVDTKDGWQTLNRELRGNVPAAGRRILRVRVTEDGQLELRFE